MFVSSGDTSSEGGSSVDSSDDGSVVYADKEDMKSWAITIMRSKLNSVFEYRVCFGGIVLRYRVYLMIVIPDQIDCRFQSTGWTQDWISEYREKQHTLTGNTAAKNIHSHNFDFVVHISFSSGCFPLIDFLKKFKIISVPIFGIVQVSWANFCVMSLGVMFCKIIR